jgi:hypothetical protein
VLSVMAHGKGEVTTAVAIGVAAARAILRLPEEQRMLSSLLIEANLSEAARRAIEMHAGLENFFSEAQRRNFERGQAKGEAAALLKILTRRGLTPTVEQKRRIVACTELAMLERWLDRSLSVSSIEELWAPRRKPPNGLHRGGQRLPANGRRKSR